MFLRNNEYCIECCKIGEAAKRVYLNLNESVFKAVLDFDNFTDNCYKLCPFKKEHNKNINAHKEFQK
jgi:hypothetical protein